MKKTKKQPVAKKSLKKAEKKPKMSPHHFHFSGVLALFVGFSAYTIASFTYSNNNYLHQITASVVDSGDIVVHEEEELSLETSFFDVTLDHPNSQAITTLYDLGIVSGFEDGTFRPDDKVTRAEFFKMVVEASDYDFTDLPADRLGDCFTDVGTTEENWFAPFVCVAKYEGWTKGYDDGSFKPGNNILKAEALKVLLEAFDFGIPANSVVLEAPYPDVRPEDSSWYLGVAQAAKDYDFISSEGEFSPLKEMSRADVSQVIYNAMVSVSDN